MVRRGKSLNSSINNNSIVEEAEPALEYGEFIKRFGSQIWTEKCKVEQLVGYDKSTADLKRRLEALQNSGKVYHVLLTGPPGTGKTTMVRKLIEQYSSELSFFPLKSSWTLQKQFGNPESRIKSLFDEAKQKQPSLIFIDRIDRVCSEKRTQIEDRVFDVLIDELEGLHESAARVMVVAATNRPESLDKRVWKMHRFFRREIRLPLPSEEDRFKYLKHLLEEKDLSEEDIAQIAKRCHCYSYLDLEELCDLASENGELTVETLETALKQLKPAAIESITTPCQPLHWNDIGGVDEIKTDLQESVIWPIVHKDEFQELGGNPYKGALLYGPPGCSKTMLAHALATESGFNFISIKGPEMFRKYVGDSEACVRNLYRNAREIAPCIIFFDEIDGFASERDDNHSGSSVGSQVVTTLLAELTALQPQENVFTIAATNRPDKVDKALLRSGRLCPHIYIPLPSDDDRRAIFKVHMRTLKLSPTVVAELDEGLDRLVEKTAGYSGAEIADVCQRAVILYVREKRNSLDSQDEYIEWRHLEEACEKIMPTTSPESLITYEKFQTRGRKQEEPIPPVELPVVAPEAPSSSSSSYSGSIIESAVANGACNIVDKPETCNITDKIDTSSAHLLPEGDKDQDAKSDIENSNQDKKKRSGTLNRLMRSLSINKKINRAK